MTLQVRWLEASINGQGWFSLAATFFTDAMADRRFVLLAALITKAEASARNGASCWRCSVRGSPRSNLPSGGSGGVDCYSRGASAPPRAEGFCRERLTFEFAQRGRLMGGLLQPWSRGSAESGRFLPGAVPD